MYCENEVDRKWKLKGEYVFGEDEFDEDSSNDGEEGYREDEFYN